MNRRSLKTQRDITQAFLELMETKPLRSISVKEISEKADVTRATFYAHYDDIYALLDQTREDAINQILIFLEKSISVVDPLLFSTELFTYFNDHSEVFALVFGENGDTSFLQNALLEVRNKKDELMRFYKLQPSSTQEHIELSQYQFTYMSGGILHMLVEWITKKEDREPVEKIAKVAADFITLTCFPFGSANAIKN